MLVLRLRCLKVFRGVGGGIGMLGGVGVFWKGGGLSMGWIMKEESVWCGSLGRVVARSVGVMGADV